jgi:hypothetical protein
MKLAKASLPVLFVYVLAGIAGWAQTNDCTTLSAQALELSGFNIEIDQQANYANDPVFVQSVIQSWQLPANSTAVVREALRQGVEPGVVRFELTKLVASGCKPEQMALVVKTLRLPLLLHITDVENAAKTPQGLKELNAYLLQHAHEWPSLPRMSALQKLDTNLGLTDFSVKNFLAVQSGMLDGLGIRGAKNMKLAYVSDWAKGQITGGHLQIMGAIYRSVNDADLKEYIQIQTSEPMKSFCLLVMRSLLIVDEQRGQTIGEEIKKNLPPGSINPGALSLGARGKQH